MNSVSERKIISMFKSFIERVFVPQLPRMEPTCKQEWTKFNTLISAEQINFGEVQVYVDTLPLPALVITRQGLDRNENKSPLFSKARRDNGLDLNTGFNPSKTFGGPKARPIFPLK
jgi:hypothetical protein